MRECRPILVMATADFAHDRIFLYLSTGTQSGAGDCATLVVPQPVPRFTRQASLPGMHQIVMPGDLLNQ
jgi:hypothetical protein